MPCVRIADEMADRLVLDATVALAIIEGERGGGTIARELRTHVAAGGELVVAEPFWLEVVNVLHRRYRRPLADVLDSVQALDELGVRSIAMDRPLTLLALELASRHGITAYDAASVAVALAEDARFLTLAEPAAAAHRAEAGSRREPSAAWSAHGAYLARVRSRA